MLGRNVHGLGGEVGLDVMCLWCAWLVEGRRDGVTCTASRSSLFQARDYESLPRPIRMVVPVIVPDRPCSTS